MKRSVARDWPYEVRLTVGDLRKLIAGARGSTGMSRVNRAFPLEAALDIYERGIAAWGADDALVPTTRGGSMIAANILRDCCRTGAAR